MKLTPVLMGNVGMVALLLGCTSTHQRPDNPSLAFGTSKISLGMTKAQVQQSLSESARHIAFTDPLHTGDSNTAEVARNDASDQSEGIIVFHEDRVATANFSMPKPKNPEELAEQIANAIDRMETKACTVSSERHHSSGAGEIDDLYTHFNCGLRSFDIMTNRVSAQDLQFSSTNLIVGIGQRLPWK